jgi:molybdopterin molybdotransferase
MFLSKFIPVGDAISIIKRVSTQTAMEEIPLEEAYHRVLAEDVGSLLNSPTFDRSAMDGYAIKAEDTFGFSEVNPVQLRIMDRIRAGQSSKINLKNGEAVKIATGAPIPPGANGVVMEEYTIEDNDVLEVGTSITPGENVSFRGEDIEAGDKVLDKGRLLRPQDLAIISSAGHDEVQVFKKPRITVITTGDELVMPKSRLQDSEIINSNHYTLKALVESSLAVPFLVHCLDDPHRMRGLLEKSLSGSDAIITTGGTAISEGDVLVDVVKQMGEVIIHGVSIRPGKPFAFGLVDGKPIFMLSGYPVAAMVQFDVLVRENLLRMQNIHLKPAKTSKKAIRKIPSTLGRTDFVRGKTDGDMVNPVMTKGSGVIRSMVESDSYIIIEENLEGIEKGKECEVLLYDSFKV